MVRPLQRPRLLLLLFCVVLAVSGRVDGLNDGKRVDLARRAIVDPLDPLDPTGGSTAATSATSTSTSTTPSSTSTSTTPTSTTSSTTSTTTSSSSTTSATSSSTQQTSNTQASQATSDALTQNTQTSTVTVPPTGGSSTSTSTSASSSATSDQDNSDSSSGVGTGTIVGLSVAGGIALLGVVGFLVWKFTRKRSLDFDDDPIKWPELNAHSENVNYALPANRAAGNTGDSVSEVDLPRQVGSAGAGGYAQNQYGQTAGASDSTAELYAPGSDPYAVPPLPGNNPNAPYRDDPYNSQNAGYYDPYRGPVPQAFNDAASMDSHSGVPNPQGYYAGGESIPMSNLNPGAATAGRRSPAPQMAYDMGRGATPTPGMGGRQSPGPGLAYPGRMSPGPGAAYGAGHRSPAPDAAYGGGM